MNITGATLATFWRDKPPRDEPEVFESEPAAESVSP
jgi:hypothetical protein